jgi:hypothetical protein
MIELTYEYGMERSDNLRNCSTAEPVPAVQILRLAGAATGGGTLNSMWRRRAGRHLGYITLTPPAQFM